MWNTIARFDQQLNANHTWGVRWLRELSPQCNQIIGRGHAAAPASAKKTTPIRPSSDAQSRCSATRGSTRCASGWTQEDVSFANPCFNGNGRNQAECPPSLDYRTYTDQQDSTAQARVNDAIQVENTFSWFLPNKRGDHDLKVGVQWQYSQSRELEPRTS